MKQKNQMLIIGGVILVIFVLAMGPSGKEGKKVATPGLEAVRTFSGGVGPNHVLPGEIITATYTPETLNFFALIEDVPSGWTADRTLSPDGRIRTTADGSAITIQWTAPVTLGQYAFGGEYFVYPDEVYTPFGADIVEVCANHDSFACSSGDVYYYTSCNDIQDVKESCSDDPCDSFGADFCSGTTIQHTRTCYTAGCPVDSCVQTPWDDTEIVTSAPNSANGVCAWQCTAGACDQNTAADTNYDGCVHDTEFPVAVSNWKQQTGGVTDVMFPSIVANWKNMANCI